jgi:hypothetical protein
MNPILDAASTWFFESANHALNGSLEVNLVEGIKGSERQYVEVGDERLGPYFPVTVEPSSRCVLVVFPACRAFLMYDESLDQPDPELEKKDGRVLFEAVSSSFRTFTEARTTIAALDESSNQEFVLCCEDRIIHVLSSSTPSVHLLNRAPDLQVERTQTWSAS